jgi:serine phosphatase RsbU (regulator of sigma subunit)
MVVGEQGSPADEAWAHRDPQLQGVLDTYMRGRLRGSGGDTPLLRALLTGEPVQIAPFDEAAVQATLGTDEVRAAWAQLDAGSCTVVPLRARSETFGVLVMVNDAARPPHSEMQIATAVEVARRGSLALDNARLYGRQLTVAETFQNSLLSPPPQPDDLEIAVRYQPAATHMHVGGDWYDSFQQPDGATLLVIGDVVGHNVDAAAAMGQIRSLLRGIAYDRAGSPAETLDRVDQVIGGLRIGSMATALLARVEQPEELARVGRRLLRWSSAGHLPPLLLPAGGGVRVLATPAERLLGTGVAGVRTDHEQVLHPGDTVVFYTDGIVEHGRSGIDEGIARLAGAVEALRDVPGEVLLDRLLARLVPDRTDDDIAVLTLRVHPQGG